MRILIINYEFPPIGGGAGKASFFIAKELAESGEKISVLTAWIKALRREEDSDGLRIHRVDSLRRKYDRCSVRGMMVFVCCGLLNLRKIIKEEKPDFIISFFTIPSGIIAYMAKIRFRIPYVIMLRGGDVPGFLSKEFKMRFWHFLTKPLIKIIWKNANRVIANSNYLLELAKKTTNRADFGVIYNGVEVRNECEDFKKDADRITLLFTGRLTQQKNLDALLHAFKKSIQNGLQNICLKIVGDGPLRRQLEGLTARLGLNHVVHFSGWKSRDEMAYQYRRSDIFISLSHEEGMSNAILEAMSFGLPVLASNIEANRELLENDGFLVNPNDADIIADAIIKLTENKELRDSLASKGKERAKDFSWKVSAKKIINYLKD